MFVAALRDLNNGKPPPTSWKSIVTGALKSQNKRGAPASRSNRREIASKMIRYWLAHPDHKGAAAYADALASEYSTAELELTRESVFKDAREFKQDVWTDILGERLRAHDAKQAILRAERANRINVRLQAGDSWEQIVGDPDVSMDEVVELFNTCSQGREPSAEDLTASVVDYPDRKRNVLRWLNEGFKLGIHMEPPEQQAAYEGARLTD